ncbi:MAG: bifunctional hydroxymethylpyrimidine kinase/phosphomethylpyrimidine kinase [Deltaproteobacteria bacterium]|nr:bifunctional hydroxymethylpyrimidine kinase/phosphomethylpyrimidine kinase [Deltaproteobacteria bacterium]MDQ3299102.1 PfkB family carbohydrate kinase [Myxococcota bacterium]
MHQRSAHRSLLVIGSVALDDIDGPFGFHKDLLGGSASFIARVASYFTNKVSVVAVVGDDFPKHHIDELTALGVDTSGIERKAGETFHWVGKYAPDLSTRETLDTRLGVFADFAPKVREDQRDAQLVLLGNIDPTLQLDVLRQVRAPALVALDTMNLWINIKRDELLKTLAKVQTLMINDEEARLLAEEHNLRRAAAKILKMGPTSVIIKRGDAGALLFHGGGAFAAPAMPLADVKDPTGAGDSFAGGLMGYLAYAGDLSPATIRTAMIMGSVMGSFAVEKFSVDGLRDLTTPRIQQRFDELAELAAFDRVRL